MAGLPDDIARAQPERELVLPILVWLGDDDQRRTGNFFLQLGDDPEGVPFEAQGFALRAQAKATARREEATSANKRLITLFPVVPKNQRMLHPATQKSGATWAHRPRPVRSLLRTWRSGRSACGWTLR